MSPNMSYFKLKLSNLELHEFLFQNCLLYFTFCQLRLQKLLPPLQYLFLHEYCCDSHMSGGLGIEHTTHDQRQQNSWIFFAFFFNYLVFQYIILLKSKLISFCVTLVNPLGSHNLIFTEHFSFNSRNLTPLQCTLSTFFWFALLSLHSSLLS